MSVLKLALWETAALEKDKLKRGMDSPRMQHLQGNYIFIIHHMESVSTPQVPISNMYMHAILHTYSLVSINTIFTAIEAYMYFYTL